MNTFSHLPGVLINGIQVIAKHRRGAELNPNELEALCSHIDAGGFGNDTASHAREIRRIVVEFCSNTTADVKASDAVSARDIAAAGTVLRSLSPIQREAMTMFYRDGKLPQDISERLGINTSDFSELRKTTRKQLSELRPIPIGGQSGWKRHLGSTKVS